MKHTITKETHEFQPITVTITIISEEELADLVTRLCINPDAANNCMGEGGNRAYKHGASWLSAKLWDDLDAVALDHGLRA